MRRALRSTGAIPGKTPDRVLFPLVPEPGESLHGFIARTAAWNFIERPFKILRRAGVTQHKDLARAVAERLPQVAANLGVQEAKLQSLLLLGGCHHGDELEYHGIKLRRLNLDTRARRVSPEGLRISAHHRANWHIAPIPFCPEGWDELIDQCPSCDERLGWSRALGVTVCEHCEFDIREAVSEAVPDKRRAELEPLGLLISPRPTWRRAALDRLPPELGIHDASSAFEVVLACSRARSAPTLHWRGRKETINDLAWATGLVFGFPGSVCDLPQPADNEVRAAFSVRLNSLSLGADGERSRAIHRILEAAEPRLHGTSRLKAIREDRRKITLSMAGRKLGLTNQQVRSLVEAKAFPSSVARGDQRKLEWFCPEEVNRFASLLINRMSAVEFSRTNGLPEEGIEQLISLGLIQVCDFNWGLIGCTGLQVTRASAEKLVKDVASRLALPDSAAPAISLVDLFTAVGAQPKPWGQFIAATLDGMLPTRLACHPSGSYRFQDLVVSAEFGRKFIAGAYPELLRLPPIAPSLDATRGFSRLEIERHLNCFPRDVSYLIARGRIRLLPGTRKYARLDVEALAFRLISSREISWRWRVSPSFRERLHRDYGLGRIEGPFWARAAVETFFEERFGPDHGAHRPPEAIGGGSQ